MNIVITSAQFEKLLHTISINQAKKAVDILSKRINNEVNKNWNIPIEELNLTVRATNALKKLQIKTVEELSDKGIDCLFGVANVGKKTINEIDTALREALQKRS